MSLVPLSSFTKGSAGFQAGSFLLFFCSARRAFPQTRPSQECCPNPRWISHPLIPAIEGFAWMNPEHVASL